MMMILTEAQDVQNRSSAASKPEPNACWRTSVQHQRGSLDEGGKRQH
jgi:hypothetical protein